MLLPYSWRITFQRLAAAESGSATVLFKVAVEAWPAALQSRDCLDRVVHRQTEETALALTAAQAHGSRGSPPHSHRAMFSRACTEKYREVSLFVGTTTAAASPAPARRGSQAHAGIRRPAAVKVARRRCDWAGSSSAALDEGRWRL